MFYHGILVWLKRLNLVVRFPPRCRDVQSTESWNLISTLVSWYSPCCGLNHGILKFDFHNGVMIFPTTKISCCAPPQRFLGVLRAKHPCCFRVCFHPGTAICSPTFNSRFSCQHGRGEEVVQSFFHRQRNADLPLFRRQGSADIAFFSARKRTATMFWEYQNRPMWARSRKHTEGTNFEYRQRIQGSFQSTVTAEEIVNASQRRWTFCTKILW